MNKKIILPVVLIALVGLVVLVSAWAGEYGAPINKGWNLVYGFLSPDQLEGQSFDKSHIKAIYAFIPQNQEYLRLYPNPTEKGKAIDQLSQQAFWVYSDKTVDGSLNGLSGFAEYWLYNPVIPYNERQIYKGWNFVGVTHDMKGVPYKEFKGSCNIVRICTYQRGNWQCGTEKDLDSEMSKIIDSDYDLGQGLVIKVTDNCKLGGEGYLPPSVPTIPEVPEIGAEDTKCSDSDGGLNYNTKGTANDGKENIADFCVDSIKLSEALCNADRKAAYAQYNCPNGCVDGACAVEDKGIVPIKWRAQTPGTPSDEEILKRIKAQWKNLDVDKDKKITKVDAEYLLKYYSGLAVPSIVSEAISANPSVYDFDGLNGFDGPTDSVYFGRAIMYGFLTGCQDSLCVDSGSIVPASWRTSNSNIPSDGEILSRIKAQWKNLDVDKSGKITTADAEYLLKYYSGLAVPVAVKESVTANPSAYDFDGLNGFDGPSDSVYFGRAVMYGHLIGCQDNLCVSN